jgi:diguanylate cyclase (GGDEF)-like protein/PAS domain S-box-containing protein
MSLLRSDANKPADDTVPGGTNASFQARLLDAVGQAIIATDPEGKVTYCNRAAEKLYGWSAEEVMGRLIMEVTLSEELAERAEEIMSELRAGRSWSGELEVRHKDGTTFTAHVTDTPVYDEQGALVAIIGVSTDITELKKTDELRRSEERFRALTQNSSDIVTLLGTDGTIRYESPSIERILGYRPEELLGENAFDYVHPDERGRVQGKFAEGLADPDLRPSAEFRFRHKDGSWRYLESVGSNLLGDPEVGEFVVNSRDITERKRVEERLRQAEARYRTLVERMPAVTYIQEIGGPDSAIYMSPQIETLTGYSPEDFGPLCKDPDLRWGMVHPDDRERMQSEDERDVEPGEVFTAEYRVVHRDGRIVWVRNESVVVELEGPSGSRYWQGFMVDITERKQAEDLVKRQADMLEQTHDAVFTWKLGGEIIYWNQGAERLYGWSKEEALGRISNELLKTIHPFTSEELDRRLRSEGHWEGELVHHTRDNRRVVVESRHVLTRYDSGPGFVLETNRDITERKRAEERLHHQAFHDLLTSLPNRQLFVGRLKQALRRTRRRPERKKVAVVFIDLDNFKVINDSLGHEFGDHLLMAVGERLRGYLRPEDTLARLGGDEFTVLVENVEHPADAVRVAERVMEALREPFVLEGQELFIKPSIGISLGEARTTTSPENLLRDADTAMYRAKKEGLGYRVFEPVMYEQALRRLKLGNELQRAIESEEFVAYYQPIIDLRSDEEVWGIEALVRWRHPQRGLLDPKEFVPAAEDSGLVVPMGERVLKEACCWAKEWQERHPHVSPLVISVNLSARQLQRPDLASTVEGVLRQTGLEACSLSLDITETVYIKALEGDTATLDELKQLGVRLSIDDFGMGYSSLSYLKRLPTDALKIDKSFIRALGEDIKDTALVKMIIDLAHTFDMEVVAEGVESEAQAVQLKEMGCELAQGYHFTEPLPPKAVSEFLAR